jgi:hypothetical protein
VSPAVPPPPAASEYFPKADKESYPSGPSVLEEGQRGLALLTFACTRRRLSSRIAAAHCTYENSTARAVARGTSWRRLRRCSEVRRRSVGPGEIKSNFNYRSPAAVTAGLAHSVIRSTHCPRAPLGGIIFIRSLRHVSVPAVLWRERAFNARSGFFEVFSSKAPDHTYVQY